MEKKFFVSNVILSPTDTLILALLFDPFGKIEKAETTDFACYVRFQSESVENNKKYAHSPIFPIRSQQASIKLTG